MDQPLRPAALMAFTLYTCLTPAVTPVGSLWAWTARGMIRRLGARAAREVIMTRHPA